MIRRDQQPCSPFVDAVGCFSPTKREVDDNAVLRSKSFADPIDGAPWLAGELSSIVAPRTSCCLSQLGLLSKIWRPQKSLWSLPAVVGRRMDLS